MIGTLLVRQSFVSSIVFAFKIHLYFHPNLTSSAVNCSSRSKIVGYLYIFHLPKSTNQNPPWKKKFLLKLDTGLGTREGWQLLGLGPRQGCGDC